MLARTADNLFWLARYVERAEFTARIIDITARLAALPKAYGGGAEWESALSAVGSLERFRETYEKADEPSVIEFLIFDPANPSSIRSCIESARTNARAVRTALTADMWQSINSAWLELRALEQMRAPFERMSRERTDPFLDVVKAMSRDFDGAAYRNMLRNDAYWFSRLGLYMERADNTARLIDVKYHLLLPAGEKVGVLIDRDQWTTILHTVSAVTAYRWLYSEGLKPWLVTELLCLKSELPRSLIASSEEAVAHLNAIGKRTGLQGEADRLARIRHNNLERTSIDEIFSQGLHKWLTAFIYENTRIHTAVGQQFRFG